LQHELERRFVELCFLSPHSDPEALLGEPDAGGQCIYQHQLAQALTAVPVTQSEEQISVTTFCRDTGARPVLSQISGRYTIRRVRSGPREFVPKEVLGPYLPEFAKNAVEVIEQLNSSLIFHGHYWDGGATALFCTALLPIEVPLVWTPHSLGSSKRQNFPGTEHESEYQFISRIFWENISLQAATQAIVSSTQEQQQMITEYAVEKEKIRTIPPGVAIEALERVNQSMARSKLGLPLDSRILLSLGRLTPFKGYHHAIEALPVIQQSSTQPVALVIMGGSVDNKYTPGEERYRARLLAQARALSIENSVFFRPALAHSEINLAYSAADIQLIMSEHEPFGLTALEAMACGTPVVATNSGGPRSFITHNVTGSLVDVRNPNRIASYVRTLLTDTYFYTSLQKAAKNFVTEHYSWSSRAKEFAAVYREALETPAPPFKKWLDSQYIAKQLLLQS
jgi:glycosyltransferase involved in cell wall biosynthesis